MKEAIAENVKIERYNFAAGQITFDFECPYCRPERHDGLVIVNRDLHKLAYDLPCGLVMLTMPKGI